MERNLYYVIQDKKSGKFLNTGFELGSFSGAHRYYSYPDAIHDKGCFEEENDVEMHAFGPCDGTEKY